MVAESKAISNNKQFQQDDTFLTRLSVRTDLLEVGGRLARIPFLPYPGSLFNQFTPDGSSMGPGAGEKYDNGTTTPVYFNQAVQITKEAEWETDSKEKSVVDVFKDSFKLNLRQFRTNLEGLVASSDGSGTLATVSSASTAGQLTVTNANNFQSQNTYQVWSALGGTFRGSITVLTVDSVNNILYLQAAAPGGTTTGDLLLVNGSSGTANTSLNGIPAINLSSTTGNWFGVPRASYPGILSTPYVSGSSGPLTPLIIQTLESYMQRATGVDTEDLDEIIAHCNVDQVTSWELLGLVSTSAGGFSSGSGQTAFWSPSTGPPAPASRPCRGRWPSDWASTGSIPAPCTGRWPPSPWSWGRRPTTTTRWPRSPRPRPSRWGSG